ncbi:hypothetical protein SKAU_G00157870 [Synaphobranchus kaupii]|uniref:Uncharacterized protein n=1 Tax=Synaphobranchus kaupii TaxID=118154 RepID=A0A9Q1FID2_SYNKA|nr:hypothetical protein SKAU_G00157870 [Synaphobranchus kaupii]
MVGDLCPSCPSVMNGIVMVECNAGPGRPWKRGVVPRACPSQQILPTVAPMATPSQINTQPSAFIRVTPIPSTAWATAHGLQQAR